MVRSWLPDLDQTRGPLYWRIAAALAKDIRSSRLTPGERLPPHRSLAQALGVTVSTVTKAFADAERNGLIVSQVGRGTYVKAFPEDLSSETESPAEVIDLSINVATSDSFNPALNRLLGALSRRGSLHALLHYYPYPGVMRHRAAAARWISKRGIEAHPNQIVVCNGAQEGLMTVFSTIARSRDKILTEKLNYTGVRHIARSFDLDVQGIETDEWGICPEALDAACSQENVAAILITPTNHNPTNALMPLERRKAIVEIASRSGALLVEDDVFGHLMDDDLPTLTSLAPDRCIYVCGLSKSIAVGLRVGYVLAPPSLVGGLVKNLNKMTLPYPAFMAELATLLINEGSAEKFVEWHQGEARARQKLAREILGLDQRTLPSSYHLWLPLSERWRTLEFVEELRIRGVLVSSSEKFSVDGSPTPRAVRVALGSSTDQERLRCGLLILADCMNDLPHRLHNVGSS